MDRQSSWADGWAEVEIDSFLARLAALAELNEQERLNWAREAMRSLRVEKERLMGVLARSQSEYEQSILRIRSALVDVRLASLDRLVARLDSEVIDQLGAPPT